METTPTPLPTKNQNFQRLAEARVNRILDYIRILGNLSNTAKYEFSEAEVDFIHSTLHKALDACYERFFPQPEPEPKPFSLSVLNEI